MGKRKHAKQKPARKPRWPYRHITTMTADMTRNQWVKKIRGRLYSFGILGDPKGALEQWQQDGPTLEAGKQPSPVGIPDDDIRLHTVCALFLQSKAAQHAADRLSRHTLRNYQDAIKHLVGWFPKSRRLSDVRPTDWERLLVELEFNTTRRGNFVVWTRSIFKWAEAAGIIDRIPKFGPNFRGPTAREKREIRNRVGQRVLEPPEIKTLLNAAPVQMKAMIYLGIQGAFGNTDCSTLTRRAINYRKALISWPRPKTAIERTVPLWPETISALQAVEDVRPAPRDKEYDELVFLTKYGNPWIQGQAFSISFEFRKLRDKVGLGEKDWNVGFYDLRRTFRTVAEETGDQHAIHRIMGHQVPGMSGIYVQRIKVEQLRRVTDHVRDWFFGT